MELLLSAISTGGLVGAANQYLCLLLLAIAARLNIISISPQMSFVSNYWFIAAAAVFWIITIAPAYASLLVSRCNAYDQYCFKFHQRFRCPAFISLFGSGRHWGYFGNASRTAKILRNHELF